MDDSSLYSLGLDPSLDGSNTVAPFSLTTPVSIGDVTATSPTPPPTGNFFTSLLGTLTPLTTTGIQAYNQVTGTTPTPVTPAAQPATTAAANNTTLYLIGAAILGLFLFMRK